ncbi:Endonuclease YhcR [Frondihabitans sp. 762G35]|uniref:ExeM/NucH family extracellular endonuclease n=1 Tax=Frondihabitans sp. 762G35 TaxID=1446794 RepID=UPI000D214463|nr:ExeM/NucH family extracellular endonuclease [Frondihabitans sp. 762G35]ARC58118.1 Endonuclease YhcR [Frondihabitans sp. 762G35]
MRTRQHDRTPIDRPAPSRPDPAATGLHRRARTGALASLAIAALGFGTLTATPAFAATATLTPISGVQGTTDVSPLAGTTVTVQGVVTADYRTGGYNGVYVQQQGVGGTTDPTPGESDAVFVYLGSQKPALAIGDLVTATGAVSEYSGLTQISATTAGALTVTTPGVGTPAPVPLPATVTGSAREAYEGMLVAPSGTYQVASSHQLSNYGSLWLTAGATPAVKNTEAFRPGTPESTARQADNVARRILLDDGYNAQVTAAAHPGDQPYFTKDSVVRNGDVVDFHASYILGYGFADWRLQPTVPVSTTNAGSGAATTVPTYEQTNPRPATVPAVGGDIEVASFNVYNYFTTLTSANANARGASTAEQFAVQRSKIVSAITGLHADVVALMEIQNDVNFGKPADTSLADLVAGLNAKEGATVWAGVRTPSALTDGSTPTDAITTALIYRTDRVTPKGDSRTQIDETVWGNAREPIAQTFTKGPETLTVVANHLKSKSGTGPAPADGQGLFTADRVAQAKSLVTFTKQLQQASGSDDVLLMGDFNAYSQEDPIQVFQDAGYRDLVASEGSGYTYSFDGELGSLDHSIATPSLAAKLTKAAVWNINSPEWSDRGYAYPATDPTSPFRSSDHDPVVVGFDTTPKPIGIDVVGINDFHGRLSESSPAAGAAVLGGMVDSYRKANPDTLFVSSGDNIGASTFTSFIQDDKPTLDALNAMKLDVSALGNHEFDKGQSDLNDRVIPSASFPYLAANVFRSGTNEHAYDAFSVKTVDGVKVGFIGAVTEHMPELVSPSGIQGLDFRSVVDSVNTVADDLTDGDASNGEADVLVLLVHEGAASGDLTDSTDDSDFGTIAKNVSPKVEAILSAHTHQKYAHSIVPTGGTTPRPVIQTGSYGENFSHLSLQIDPVTHELITATGEVKPLYRAFAPDPAVATIVTDAEAVAKVKGSVSVGTITGDFDRARQADGTTENRGGESTLGNFVADVQLDATKGIGSQIAFMNPGGLRADLKYASSGSGDADGNVTYQEAAAVQPFANTLVQVGLTGAQIRSVLEQQWQPTGSSRPFLKLGVSKGLLYDYDPSKAAGSRIGRVTLDGTPLDDAATYKVTVNSFLASGGDNFTAFAQGATRADTGKVDLQSQVDYFTAHPEAAAPDLAQRAVGVSLPTAPQGGYRAGDTVSLGLSSLIFSRGGPASGTVSVSLGGKVLGSAPIDATVVDGTDEQGRATVPVTIPASAAAGSQELVVTVSGTATSIPVPITIAETAKPIASVTAPTISGRAAVGRTITATEGTWSVAGTTQSFQWLRDGVAVPGATSARYTLTGADAGTSVTVAVTATKTGYTAATATSAAVTVAKVASTVQGSADRWVVLGKQAVTYTVRVTGSQGVRPTGTVTVYDNGRAVGTATLSESGTATLALPRLSRGLHLLTAGYSGDAHVAGSSQTWPGILLVL